MSIQFHHGPRVIDHGHERPLFQTPQSAVIWLQGTAPEADEAIFAENQPFLFYPSNRSLAERLGSAGTIPEQLTNIWRQGGLNSYLGAYIFVNIVPKDADPNVQLSHHVGSASALTGVHAAKKVDSDYGKKLRPRLFCVPGFTDALATDGISAINVLTEGTGYGENTFATWSGGGGAAAELRVNVEGGKVTSIIPFLPGFGFTSAPTITIIDPDGGGSGATAEASVGAVGNPVAHELVPLLEEYKAVGFIDGPNTTDSDAVVTRAKYGSDRLMMVDPQVLAWDSTDQNFYVPYPASAMFAGVQARVDHQIGFFKSVSNEPIHGVDNTNRPITYGNQTNYLNENCVSTVVNFGEGFLTWGNRSLANKFLSQRRARDFINEAIEDAVRIYVDRAMTEANLKFLEADIRGFMRSLAGQDFVYPDFVTKFDPEKNTKEMLKAGKVVLDLAYETPPPMEDIKVDAYDYPPAYELLIDRVNNSITEGALST